jgi:hypothetical protein
MRSIRIDDVHPKIGDIIQTTSDFVVIENIDDSQQPRYHARSVRTGQRTIMSLSSIRGIMIPVSQAASDPAPFDTTPLPEASAVPVQPAEKSKGYDIVKGVLNQVKREQVKRHQHVPSSTSSPAITQE